MRGFEEQGLAAFRLDRRDPGLQAFTDRIFTDKFREQAKGATFELGALSIGMQLEQNAVSYFSGAAENATDQGVKEFYEFLADWEREHLEALQTLHNSARQDFWSEGGFAPF